MFQTYSILRVVVLTAAVVVLGASGASAMPIHDVTGPVANTALSPDRLDAAAHAATIRGIGAALLARADS